MRAPVRAADVVVGLLTENTPRMLVQAIRFLRSLRWFGGELAGVRVILCGVGPLEAGARATLESLGAEIRTVARFHPSNPTANRHQLIAELLEEPQEILFLIDCDTIIVRDPLPYMRAEAFQAKPAPTPTVTDEVFDRLFRHFGLPKPAHSHIAPFTGTPMIPYFNAGVMVIPKAIARTLAPAWRKYNQVLADQPKLTAPCQRHMHQASLTLALAETGVPTADLPVAMNFQTNATHFTPPEGFAETDPAIIHYHQFATDDGFVLPCPYPAAQARIEMFHERLRAEGFTPFATSADVRASRPVVVLGMHRSGTSVVAQVVSALGIYPGAVQDLVNADMFNPTGFWERKDVVLLDDEVLSVLGTTWIDALRADISLLSDEQRSSFLARAKNIIERSMLGHGPFLLKDPRMALLFPLWREVLQDPVCVIVWRDPMAVARSLATRDQRPRLVSIAAWEHQTRTLLRDTEGLPRVIVSYEELLAEPSRIMRNLHDALTGFGVEGLSIPPAEQMDQMIKADFNRSGRKARAEESLLDDSQRTLVEQLKSGAAIRESVAPTPARALELLAEFAQIDALRQSVAERDLLLSAVFDSRSWRLGHRMTRLLRRGNAISAADRWRDLKNRPV